MADKQRMNTEIAQILRQNIDEISDYVVALWAIRYSTRPMALSSEHAANRRAHQQLRIIADVFEADDPAKYHYNPSSADDAIKTGEKLLSPIMNFMEGSLFMARSVAPFVWRAFEDDYDYACQAIECLEDMFKRVLSYSLVQFDKRLAVPGILSSDWDLSLALQTDVAKEEQRASLPPEHAMLKYGLSSRECEVLRLVAQGKTNGEIAAALDIRQNTVKNHVGHIFVKLDVGNRTELAKRAIDLGLAE